MKILLIDNYDSFTFNLYQMVGNIFDSMGEVFTIDVVRNDKITLEEIKERKYDRIIISPGPGDPADSAYFGICGKVIHEIGLAVPIFGVCLGMQGIANEFGGKVILAENKMHGKLSEIAHDKKGIFAGLPQQLEVMRYHSLVVEPRSLPDCLEVSAYTIGGKQEIMGLRHKIYPICGVQFHPESFVTEAGEKMLRNFLWFGGLSV
ncbi:MAG: anthranilate/aminodeoxychorismate synthase component II [Candidatus Magasanikbacteria bacterium CG_4_10_14_0_2_um_filter_37_12]|uniref:Anthranilate/aminodeoxychorismate synthase component II n=1 Tax=Candidatus Magasanikbacteria bacterium CG_4_10_14_0_2_um_filter_37_12 TaxID=1974637 RepID=A0A2M7V6X6_9BACT|nr:MAG: anthranilate/aminodeoxychorismate synthase component II [Candidatus Magasanikbacteria bacterium CG_4_10_14_0_2_um_filter_37_12]